MHAPLAGMEVDPLPAEEAAGSDTPAAKRHRDTGDAAQRDLRAALAELAQRLNSPDAAEQASTAELLARVARTASAEHAPPELRQCLELLASLRATLQGAAADLHAGLKLHSLPPVPPGNGLQPTPEAAKRVATYAHKLSYTTFAPAVVLGQNLHRPPAPQESDFRAAGLHRLSRKVPEVGPLPEAEQPASQQQAAALPAAASASKAAQPLEGEAAQPRAPPRQPAEEPVVAQPPADGAAAAVPAAAPATRGAFDFILNPDLEEVDEMSSSEDDSD